jgi:response regulator RpfG family c-di-GMP phosphodiesterase
MEASESYESSRIIRKGDVDRSILTIDHMLKTMDYGLLIYDNLPESLRQDQPTGYRGMLEFALWHHDISKTIENGWDDGLLLGARHATKYEWENVIIPHPEIAANMIRKILEEQGTNSIETTIICDIVRLHHARFDGKNISEVRDINGEGVPFPDRYGGYPAGYDYSNTPMGAMIAKLADAFSARYEKRNYRSKEENGKGIVFILEHMKERAGTEYWPEALEALLKIPHRVLKEVQAQHIWDKEIVTKLRSSMAKRSSRTHQFSKNQTHPESS